LLLGKNLSIWGRIDANLIDPGQFHFGSFGPIMHQKFIATTSIGLPYPKELSMTASTMGPASTEHPREKNGATHCPPMPQQQASGDQGHEMHPQQFVRLVGCHDLNPRKQEAA
jgi:hypothetical protein